MKSKKHSPEQIIHQREATPGEGALAVIEDPAGAVAALYQPADDA